MKKRLSELISESDLIIVGIGNEWNWIKEGIKQDDRYNEILKYCDSEGKGWLLPIIEFEYGFYNNNEKIDRAYRALKKLIGERISKNNPEFKCSFFKIWIKFGDDLL